MSSIAKLERTSLSQRAADAILEMIITRQFPPGGRLPSETVLAKQLGVTRLTLREALSRLCAMGYTKTQHGLGTRVLEVEADGTFFTLSKMLRIGRELSLTEAADMLEFRASTMTSFVDQMVARASADTLAAMDAVLAQIKSAPRSPEVLAALDHDFESSLASASGNHFLMILVRSTREVYLKIGELVHREHDNDAQIYKTQAALASAIRAKDAARARALLSAYLDGASKALSAVVV